jgi:flavin-binding protein dodecin
MRVAAERFIGHVTEEEKFDRYISFYTLRNAFDRKIHLHGENMSDHVYKQIEITGSSTQSSDDAARVAIERASTTLRNLQWFEVRETRGNIQDGKIAHWQVTLKVGLLLDD